MNTSFSQHSESGALFGLDARIALAIFGVLSLVSGAALLAGLDSSRAKSLATELSDLGKGIEALQYDLRDDIFTVATVPNGTEAFRTLFDKEAVAETGTWRGRWLGPYITFTGTQHPRYGAMSLEKHPAVHSQSCGGDDTCYQWVVYGNVKPSISAEVNTIIDGPHETTPENQGRLQWDDGGDDTGILYYRAAKALTTEER
ncbi:MAG: hypothetical protein H6922_01475 [Pseudomonadaceae bacterium]|nr:hypothetical protein [Pseudomonadaceae bacterium]